MNRRLNSYILQAGSIIGLDLFSKNVAISLASETFEIIEGWSFLRFEFALNKGIAFSFLDKSHQLPLVIMISMTLLVFSYFIKKRFDRKKNIVPEIMFLSGGVANLIGRIAHGGVVDFLEMQAFGLRTSVFNFADAFITVGIIIIMVRSILELNQQN